MTAVTAGFGIAFIVGLLGFITTLLLLGKVSMDADRLASIASILVMTISVAGAAFSVFVLPGLTT